MYSLSEGVKVEGASTENNGVSGNNGPRLLARRNE